ncbi:probable protein phosphatase 2C 4 [Salvia hispanica]|uniref:probable protein phosphatase 2C 4 n=1 Tax=Salvia hispanica TaxID=49212 RepID=UPI00200904E4|nr:probable protein phosphatase 2C 4 [Salvia hispanica]
MGNGVGKFSLCFAGDAGEISRRRNDISVCLSDPLDEGLGHSFCYIPSENLNKSQSTETAAFRSISGAAISANTSTPLSTDAFSYTTLDKASTFESTNFFSSIPLQPIPKTDTVKSGPIMRSSGLMDRGFLSGPIERSFASGPLDMPKSKKMGLVKNFKKVVSKSLWSFSREVSVSEGEISSGNSSSTITSHNLSSELSLVDENNDDAGNECNLQWAQGKAGEDRVHIVISEENGWVFVGIYDGFNGPDATDFLLNNLYANVYKELKGLLWFDGGESGQGAESLDGNGRVELERKLRERLTYLGCDGAVDHSLVLEALSEALRKTEASYLEIADMMLVENPELALMGSCVLAMVMKGDDVYLMNVGDSRAVLARRNDSGGKMVLVKKDGDELLYGYEYDSVHYLSASQLTMDHSTCVKEEVRRIRYAHLDDAFAVVNKRVKGSLKVTRAFGAGFLKQPKWNNALLEMFRIDYIGTSPYITCSPFLCHHRLQHTDKFLILSSDGLYQYFTNKEAVSEVETFMSMFPEGDPAQHLVEEVLVRAAKKAGMDFYDLLEIPQGERRRYHDDVSIVIISLKGKYNVHHSKC